MTGCHFASSSRCTAWEALSFNQLVGPPRQASASPSKGGWLGGLNTWSTTVNCAEREAPAVRPAKIAKLPFSPAATRRCLTPRSSRAPTAKCQARAAAHIIICSAGLAFSCRARLNSNVRHQKATLLPIAAGGDSPVPGCSLSHCSCAERMGCTMLRCWAVPAS